MTMTSKLILNVVCFVVLYVCDVFMVPDNYFLGTDMVWLMPWLMVDMFLEI